MKRTKEEKMMMINAVADEWFERFQKSKDNHDWLTDEAIDFRIMCVNEAREYLIQKYCEDGARFPKNLENKFHCVFGGIFDELTEELYAGREKELYKKVDEEEPVEEVPACEKCEHLNNIASYLYEDAMGYFFEIRDLQKDWVNEVDDEDEKCNRICYLLKCACAKAYAETFADGDMEYPFKNLPDTLQGIFVRVFEWATSEEEVFAS